MKTARDNPGPTSRGQGILMAIVAACALGVGITGTLLWTQSRPAPVPTSSPVTSVVTAPAAPVIPGVPDVANLPNPAAQTHEPPAELTAGQTAPQKALTLGNWYYDHEQWPLAITNYRAAIAGGLDNSNVRTDMGNALRFAGQPQKALEQYQIAQKKDPTHEQSLFNQGALYAASMNNPEKGIKVWQTYLKRFPNGQSVDVARSLIAQAKAAN